MTLWVPELLEGGGNTAGLPSPNPSPAPSLDHIPELYREGGYTDIAFVRHVESERGERRERKSGKASQFRKRRTIKCRVFRLLSSRFAVSPH